MLVLRKKQDKVHVRFLTKTEHLFLFQTLKHTEYVIVVCAFTLDEAVKQLMSLITESTRARDAKTFFLLFMKSLFDSNIFLMIELLQFSMIQ